jgi:folate-binding Fe-S cluster repair protein YgfZ
MGQELTARTKYRGLIKRRLFPVKVEGDLPAPGTPVERDGKEVGEIRSGHGDRAIAMLQLEAARAPLSSGGATITAEVPGWMRLPEAAS